MKRERISLFILVVEIALITFLHTAKNQKTEDGKPVAGKGAAVRPHTGLSLISFK